MKLILTFLMNNRNELLKFAFVGFTLFLLSNIMYLLLKNVLSINYLYSIGLTNIISMFIHYLLNKNFTYNYKSINYINLFKYLIYIFLNYIFSLMLSYIFVSILSFNSNYLIFYTTPVTMFSSYLLMKFFVFRKY